MSIPNLGRAVTLAIVRNVLFILPPLICAVFVVEAGFQAGLIPLEQSPAVQWIILGYAILALCTSVVLWRWLIVWPSQIEQELESNRFVVNRRDHTIVAERRNVKITLTLDRPFADYRGHPSWTVTKNGNQWIRGKVGSFDPRYMYELGTLEIYLLGMANSEIIAMCNELNAKLSSRFRIDDHQNDNRSATITTSMGTWMGKHLIAILDETLQIIDQRIEA